MAQPSLVTRGLGAQGSLIGAGMGTVAQTTSTGLSCTVDAHVRITAALRIVLDDEGLSCAVQAPLTISAVLDDESYLAAPMLRLVAPMAYHRPALFAEDITLGEDYSVAEDLTAFYGGANVRPQIRRFSLKLGGKEVRRELLSDLEFELTTAGGPETATVTQFRSAKALPAAILKRLVCTYKGQRLFGGRLEGRTRDLEEDGMGTTLTFKGTICDLENRGTFRCDYVDSDLEHWSLDQPPGTGGDAGGPD